MSQNKMAAFYAARKNTTLMLAQLGVLTAIILIFEFTGIGMIKIGPVEMTIMMIPVIIGAISIGPVAGAILGGMFGLMSFYECFGKSMFGVLLFGINPFACAFMCFVPRILAGFLTGIIFKALKGIDRTKLISFGIAGLSGAVLNTLFFMGSLWIFFWGSDTFISTMQSWGLSTEAFFPFAIAFVGVNGLIEAIVCFVTGSAIAKAVVKFINRA